MGKKIFLLFLLVLIVKTAFSQNETDLAIGQWKQHLPFKSGRYVTQSDKQIFYSTAYALLIIDKDERSLQQVTKVEGLSRVGVNLVKYNQGAEVLVVVFDDGGIDLLSDEGNITLNGVPQSSIILGEKRINDVFMANDSIAYLAGNFGVSTLNVRTGLFPNTIRTSVEVFSAVVYKNSIYAATDLGIYTIALDTPTNLDDFSNWEWLGNGAGFPADYSSGPLVVHNDNIYMDLNDSLFVYNGNEAAYVHHVEDFTIQYLSADGSHLIVGFDCPGNCRGKVLIFEADNSFREPASNCFFSPKYATEDEEGNIWFADNASGFRIESGTGGSCEIIPVDSYQSIHTYDIEIADNGDVWVASGGLSNAFTALFRTDGFSSLIEGDWTQFKHDNTAGLSSIFDYLDIKTHPNNGKIYAAAYLDALVEFDPETEEVRVFNETNSSLQLSVGDIDRSRVTNLAFDQDNNLWMCNHNAPEPLSVLYSDDTWDSYELDCTSEDGIIEMAIDEFGNKWLMTTVESQGLIVFNENDKDVAVDDQCQVINTSNSELPSNEISSIAVDLEGAVWVGTKLGAVVFQCDPFDPDCRGTRPFVEVDGFGANLLEDQDVTAIGVDGANRKWFGTLTGIFVMSPEGNEQIVKFTEENSSLFDNNITDINFNYQTGEAYIGTVRGLISYRSQATLGGTSNSSNVLVFPNPVRPEYQGPIAIKGLAQDATIKITDVSGQLVFETEALGGQAIWDGRDYNERKVNTGVYLVFSTSRNSSNPDVAVAKILVVN